MRKYSQQTFGITACVAGGTQRRPQTAFGLGDRTFDVPPVPVDPRVKSPFHLSAVAGFRPFATVSSSIQMDHGATNAKFLAGKAMVVLCVVPRVAEQPIDRQMARRLPNRLRKLRGVLTRPVADHGPGKQVRGRMTNNGQLRPPVPKESFVSDTTNIVTGGLSTFQTGGVDHRFRLVINQATCFRKAENRLKEPVKSPFFSRRSCAYLSVE